MHAVRVAVIVTSLLSLSAPVMSNGVRIPFRIERIPKGYSSRSIRATRRTVDELAGYDNLNDSRYLGEVLVSGRPFEVSPLPWFPARRYNPDHLRLVDHLGYREP